MADAEPRLRRAGAGSWLLLAVGVAAVSTSGPLIAAIAAPALAIAFWRNALASAVLGPVTAVRRRDEVAGLDRRTVGGCLLAGVLLAAHFATWVPSVTMTSVATSTALVSTLPIWTALFAAATGRRVGALGWAGVLLAVTGAVLMTGADLAVSARALAGDALALTGGFFAAAYVTVGERIRRTVSTTVYTTICYPACALLLLVACLVSGARLGGYPASSWLLLLALTVGPQFLGHSVINRVLSALPATVVGVAILLEVPGAALLALVFLDQRPPTLAVPGIVVLLAGLALVVLTLREARHPEAAAEL
ncbi:MAG TPA: DMT family transporter [Cryptosporangiaceae bacterium]|nr:DMT family transporter [Cryptosporangiaceae bacterium]